jgi:hypothetical protein
MRKCIILGFILMMFILPISVLAQGDVFDFEYDILPTSTQDTDTFYLRTNDNISIFITVDGSARIQLDDILGQDLITWDPLVDDTYILNYTYIGPGGTHYIGIFNNLEQNIHVNGSYYINEDIMTTTETTTITDTDTTTTGTNPPGNTGFVIRFFWFEISLDYLFGIVSGVCVTLIVVMYRNRRRADFSYLKAFKDDELWPPGTRLEIDSEEE